MTTARVIREWIDAVSKLSETKLSADEFKRHHGIDRGDLVARLTTSTDPLRVINASGGPGLTLGTLEDIGAGMIFRERDVFGFSYRKKLPDGTPITALIDIGIKKGPLKPGDTYEDAADWN